MNELHESLTPGAKIKKVSGDVTRLTIPGGETGAYRLAQLDNYRGLKRSDFLHQARLRMCIEARVSAQELPGTWGFGLWNDPFSLSLGLGGGTRRLPALPQAAWFFFASERNYLSFRDDQPAHGMLAGVFRSLDVPTWALSPAGLALPFMALRPLARIARRAVHALIDEGAARLSHNVTDWQRYELHWEADFVEFSVNHQVVFRAALSPRGPLGFVLWIDNQFAAFPPDGTLSFGTLANPAAWLEFRQLTLEIL